MRKKLNVHSSHSEFTVIKSQVKKNGTFTVKILFVGRLSSLSDSGVAQRHGYFEFIGIIRKDSESNIFRVHWPGL